MKFLRQAEWVELFMAAFLIGGCFHLALGALGVVAAFANPGLFHTGVAGAQHAVGSLVGALGVLSRLMLFLAAVHLVVSATGALVWLGVRQLAFRRPVR